MAVDEKSAWGIWQFVSKLQQSMPCCWICLLICGLSTGSEQGRCTSSNIICYYWQEALKDFQVFCLDPQNVHGYKCTFSITCCNHRYISMLWSMKKLRQTVFGVYTELKATGMTSSVPSHKWSTIANVHACLSPFWTVITTVLETHQGV